MKGVKYLGQHLSSPHKIRERKSKLAKKKVQRIRTSQFISLGKVPPEEYILKKSGDQKIKKLCGQLEWQERKVYITAENFLIVDPKHKDDIADLIPLVKFLWFWKISNLEFVPLNVQWQVYVRF